MTGANMDVDSLLDKPGFCRLCVVNYDPGNMTEIFENKDFGSIGLMEMIKTVTNIEVEMNGLPTSICNRCVDELEKAHRFIQVCVAGNNFLCNELFEAHDQVTVEPYIKMESDDESSYKSMLDMPILSPQTNQRASDEPDEGEKSITERESYSCAQCGSKFTCKSNLLKHVIAGHTKRSQSVGEKEADRLEHICVAQENRPSQTSVTFECAECAANFTTKALLEKHVVRALDVSCKSVTPEKSRSSRKDSDDKVSPKTFYCFKCLAEFTDKDKFINHIIERVCTAVQPKPAHIKKAYKHPTCPNCLFRFSTVDIFLSHIRWGNCKKRPSYSNREICFCPSCRRPFTSKADLHRHLIAYQCEPPKDDLKFSCLHCLRKFTRKDNVRRHFVAGRCTNTPSLSERGRKIRCIICPDKFTDVDALRNHLRLKQCKKPLLNGKFIDKKQCPTCPNMFSSITALRKHLRFNRCKMPIPISFFERQCTLCRMVFEKPEEVQSHLRLGHCKVPEPMNGVKSRQCPLCQAIFTEPRGVTRHLRFRRCKELISNCVSQWRK